MLQIRLPREVLRVLTLPELTEHLNNILGQVVDFWSCSAQNKEMGFDPS